MNELRMLLHDIEQLEKISFSSYTEPLIALKDVKRMIESHLLDNDGWIACSDHLPEEGQEVWITTKTDIMTRGMYTKHFGSEHKEGFMCNNRFMWVNMALYWMPFIVPEPYKPFTESVDNKNIKCHENKVKEINSPNNREYEKMVEKKIEDEFLAKTNLKQKL